jgi:DinB superfamily
MTNDVIQQIKTELEAVFLEIDKWFDEDVALVNYQPLNGSWSVSQVLHHIGLTNHFLHILIRKGTAKALKLAEAKGGWRFPEDYRLNTERLNIIGEHGAFIWHRPDHMEPAGLLNPGENRLLLQEQVNDCIFCLEQIPNGEGTLSTTTMTVNNLGKLDVYHYIYFLAQHAKRHLTQLEKIRLEKNKAS